MKKEFIVKKIDSAPDGSPYVIVSLISPRDMEETRESSSNSPDMAKIDFTKPEDMAKELNKMFQGMGADDGKVTVLKMDLSEYKESNLSVGDKVYVELKKFERHTG